MRPMEHTFEVHIWERAGQKEVELHMFKQASKFEVTYYEKLSRSYLQKSHGIETDTVPYNH